MLLAYKPRLKTTRLLLHASHTVPGEKPNLKAFLGVRGRQMGLLEVGYHFLILQDGRLVECRPHNVQGSHVRGRSNRDSIGVCLEGGAVETLMCDCVADKKPCSPECIGLEPEDNFKPPQWQTLRFLRAYLWQFYGDLPLFGHSEVHPHHHRQCPPTNMEKVRECTSS